MTQKYGKTDETPKEILRIERKTYYGIALTKEDRQTLKSWIRYLHKETTKANRIKERLQRAADLKRRAGV